MQMKLRVYRMAFAVTSLVVFMETVGAPKKWS